MLLRLRWFLVGAVSSIAGVMYAGVKLRRARQRYAPAALVERGRRAAAGVLDRTADRVDPSTGSR